MYEELTIPRLIKLLEQALEQFPDQRIGENTRYNLPDAGMGAFSVFFTQSPSFLAHQRAMKLNKGRCNAESLFEIKNIPSDNQLRNLLDPVSPTHLSLVYRQVFQALEHGEVLTSYRSFARRL